MGAAIINSSSGSSGDSPSQRAVFCNPNVGSPKSMPADIQPVFGNLVGFDHMRWGHIPGPGCREICYASCQSQTNSKLWSACAFHCLSRAVSQRSSKHNADIHMFTHLADQTSLKLWTFWAQCIPYTPFVFGSLVGFGTCESECLTRCYSMGSVIAALQTKVSIFKQAFLSIN